LLFTDLTTQKRRYLTYGHIDASGASNGGYGTLAAGVALPDTDRDGMPDYWERAIGLMPAVDDHNGLVPDCVFSYVPAGLGYTFLEDYLQWLALPHGVVAKRSAGMADTFLDVDLRKFTLGLGTATTYSVRSPTHGSVSLQADGHTARFIPEASFTGRAGFSYSGTDQDKSSIGFDVGVLVADQLP
jgi:Bacterial Ig domain